MALRKVILGAQTGVDKAALDAAVKVGVAVNRYCTKDGLIEDLITEKYPIEKLETLQSEIRIENNVVVSDGTLILNKGRLTGGSKLSYDFAVKHFMPCLIIQLDADNVTTVTTVIEWIHKHKITTLNIAGPREAKFTEGIYKEAYSYLERLFSVLE